MIPPHFMPIRTFARTRNKRLRSLMIVFGMDMKKGRKDRFLEIDGVVYIDKHYPYTKEKADYIKKSQDLYYEIFPLYPSMNALAKDLSKELGISIGAATQRLIDFKFAKDPKEVAQAFERFYERKKNEKKMS